MYVPMADQSIFRLLIQRDLDISAVADAFEGHSGCTLAIEG